MRRSILYFASWRLVIASSCWCLVWSRIAPSSVPDFRDRQVLPEAPDETAGRETARGPESPRRARFLRGKPGQVKPAKPRLDRLLVDVDFDRSRDERTPRLQI